MKRFILIVGVLVAAAGMVSAESVDPISSATAHAAEDAEDYTATGWGAMAFGASVLLSPLLGGGGVIVAANVAEPNVDLPSGRLSFAQESFESGQDVMLYRSQYEESMEDPIKRSRSRRAWFGTGIGLAVNVTLIAILLSGV